MILALSLALNLANAADIDPRTLEALARQQTEIQALEAERDALKAKCAKACVPAPVVAPAPKPKATTGTKPAPKPAAAPKAVVTVPDPKIAALEAEIAALKAQIAALPAPTPAYNDSGLTARVVALEARPVAVNTTVYQPTVEHKTTVYRASGTRAQIGLSELGVVAPPLPGESSWVSDRTEISFRYSWNTRTNTWVALEVDAGYGFIADATSIRALPELVLNLGAGTDLVMGAGPSFVCESAFTGGPLCSATRTGGQGQVGIAFQAFGPTNVEIFAGGGYDMVDSASAGIGGVGYGYGGVRAFVGTVGRGSTVTVR